MSLRNIIRKYRLHFGLLAMLLALAGGVFVTQTRAQGQVCRDFDNITICADKEDFPGSLEGNLRIGPKGQPPVVRVRSYPGEDPRDEPNFEALFLDDSVGPNKGALWGSIELINAPRALSLVQTHVRAVPGSTDVYHDGMFVVDTVNMVIRNATSNEDTETPPALRNHFFDFPFIEHAGLTAMTKDLSTEEYNQIEAQFHLGIREFRAELPGYMPLNVIDTQNSTTRVTLLVGTREDGSVAVNIKDLKLKYLGMIGDLKSIKLVPRGGSGNGNLQPQQTEGQNVQFEAEALEFSRADNPGLPNLDATKPNLVFSLQGLQFKDGRFTLRGGAVGLPDWQISRAFKLTNQQVSIETNKTGTSSSLIISSTLAFPSGSVATDARTFPMGLRISGKEQPNGEITTAITGTLRTSARPALDLGPLSISTPAKTELVYDPTQNFFGLKADQVTLRWDSGLGGGSGIQSNMRLGVDRNNNLSFGFGGGGAVALPPMRSSVLTVQVGGGIASTADLTTFTLFGNADLALPGDGNVKPGVTMFIRSGKDVRDTCSSSVPTCKKRFEWSISRFEFSLAGFGIGVNNARGTGDGGFAVDSASLKAPIGVKSFSGSIQGLTISGSGNVSITGGSVELPPLQIGGFSLAGVKGSFLKTATGYEFKGRGTMPLPGLEPNSDKKISGEVVVRARPDGSFTGFGVSVAFDTGSPGIPIANTGMELTQLRGGFDVNSGTVKITVGMRASSQIRFGPLPAVTADGTASVQFQPFQLTANAKLSVLVIQVAEASIGIGHQQGFDGGPGFNVSFDINFILAHGETELRIGPATLSDGRRKTIIAATAAYTVGIKRSAIFPLMPPRDINVARLDFKGGTFTVKGKDETLGLLGRVKISMPLFVPDVKVSVFVNLEDRKVDVTDTDDYKLIDGTTIRARAAQGVAGYSARTLTRDERQALGFAGDALIQQETLPVVLPRQGVALFGISYPAGGTPNLRLQLPDGSILTEQTVDPATSTFLRYTDSVTEPHELAFVLANAQPGTYRLIVDNATTEYNTVSYMINADPVVSEVAVSCGGTPINGVTMSCNGAASGSAVTITWTAQDTDSPTATVQLAYAPLRDDGSADVDQLTMLAEGLPLSTGSFTWNVDDVPSGSYGLVVTAIDNQNAPVEVVATTTIQVVDQRAPAVPQGLTDKAQPGELLVEWTPNAERDVAGYEIGFGIVETGQPDSSTRFIYSRDMGAKETSVAGGDVYDAKLWGLTDNQEIFFGLRAYDRSGNTSDWSLQRAKPWALAPDAWTPLPDGELPATGHVEVAFASPLNLPVDAAVPAGLIEVRRIDGSAVAGTTEVITNLEGDQVMGLHFVPAAPLRVGVTYTVVVKGGAAGVTSTDGRQMAQDYVWSFQTVAGHQVYLPLVLR